MTHYAAFRDNLFFLWCFGNMCDPIDAISSIADCPHCRLLCKYWIPCRHQFDCRKMQLIHVTIEILGQDNRNQCLLGDIHQLNEWGSINETIIEILKDMYISFHVRTTAIYVYTILWAVYVHLLLSNWLLMQPTVLELIRDFSFPFQSGQNKFEVIFDFFKRYVWILWTHRCKYSEVILGQIT